jgi:transposase
MITVGVDTHKATLAACAVDELGRPLEERTFSNDPPGHAAMRSWVAALGPQTRVGVEGSSSYGAAVARHLLREGVSTVEVPPHLSRVERTRTRRAGKSDPGDAYAIARVTAREQALPPVRLPGLAVDLQLLVSARDQLVEEATRVRNGLHAHLVVLLPGYGERIPNLIARANRERLRRELRGRAGVQAELARADLARLGMLQAEIDRLARRIRQLVAGHPLLAIDGVAGLTAAKLIGRIGDPSRFRSEHALARLAGVAPIPASSGHVTAMRLDRGGDRQLNRALYSIAVTQARSYEPAKTYLARKRAEGKTWRSAIRSLKRRIVRRIYRAFLAARQDPIWAA